MKRRPPSPLPKTGQADVWRYLDGMCQGLKARSVSRAGSDQMLQLSAAQGEALGPYLAVGRVCTLL